MKMGQEQFDVATLKHIRNKLDYIYSISREHHNDNPLLMDTIASLTKVANMFAKCKLEELNDDQPTSSPQGYIVKNLGHSYLSIKEFEKQKENTDFPSWKL
jgi:hypothetical protein